MIDKLLVAVLVAGAAGAQAPLVRVSDGPSPFVAGCDGATPQGKETNYPNSEVEPRVAANPPQSGTIVTVAGTGAAGTACSKLR